MRVEIKQIILLIVMFYIPFQDLFSQHTSKDNYTGEWGTPTTWNPIWTLPQTSISGFDITINGYITLTGSLSFTGSTTNLIVNDTLVIIGNLTLGNKNNVTVNDKGILIIRGDLTIGNQTIIKADGYLVVTNNVIKNSSVNQGSFTSNDNPVKVFIGGIISPVELTNNYPNFPVLNCTTPITTTYLNSTCSYGNMIDIQSDPIDSFFKYKCTTENVNSNISVCAANTINLTSSSGIAYSWSGPSSFTSTAQNPLIPNASISMAGAYTIILTAAPGCIDIDIINVIVNDLPIATAGSNNPVCAGNTINLTSAGGNIYNWKGPNGFTNTSQNPTILNADPTMDGNYTVTVTASNGCIATAPAIVTVNGLPLVSITSSNSPLCVNDSQTLTGNPAGGTFIVTGGPGNISGNVLSATGIGIINLEYNYTNICFNTAKQSIIVNEKPVAVAGSDQELKFIFETQMEAELSSSGTGEWSLVSGSGKILDIRSSTSRVTELSIGGNKFLWTVRNGSCETSDEVKITVYDLFVPSVITPNGDGKNDYFQISALVGRVELIIFNKWGNLEYENSNYLNNWDGRNNKGAELPDDTYFYKFKLGNGITRKGTVLITR
jgi:gliding motility-associated-like protein